ncbi:MAG TPA: HicB family protein, partial [Citreicella sp.]|nr:HicB family protein [Citreicella sp.]
MVNYPIHIEPDGDGYLVTCPDLPEVTSDGATMEAAFANGADAVDEALAGRLDEFLDIPQPSEGDVTVSVPSLTGLKVMLYWELRDQDLCRADLMEALG